MCAFFEIFSFENYTSKFRPHLRHKISCSFSPFTHLLLPSSSYPWLPMVVSFFLTHLLLKWHLRSSFFMIHSTAIHLQEAKDSIDEEDPRPTSSTSSYVKWYQEHLHLGDVLLLPLTFCSVNLLYFLVLHLILHVYPPLSCGLVLFRVDLKK